MRVGLNLLYLVPGAVGGSEIYARRLVDALARARPSFEFIAFCGNEAAPSLAKEGWPANVRIHRIPVDAANKPLRAAAELTLLPGAAKRAKVDLLHSLGTTSPPFRLGTPGVTEILDLIYEHYPETFPPAARLGLKLLVGPGAKRADRVITISAAVKRDVVATLGLDPAKVDPVLLGFGMKRPDHATPEPTLRDQFGLGTDRVVLCVSAALVHKNLPRLIDAFAKLDLPDTRLVLAGHAGREQQALLDRARTNGVADRVTLTGWISNEDLEGLYALAACCAYPSLHEGFGLPVLEAMARDRPIASSNATSLPEVAGDAAELFDPLDTDAMAAAIRRLLTDDQRVAELVAKGRTRVEHFTWERCAEGVLEVYEKVLRPGRSGTATSS